MVIRNRAMPSSDMTHEEAVARARAPPFGSGLP